MNSAPKVDNEIATYQKMLDDVVASPRPFPEGRFAGRGIVICAGGDRYYPPAWVCIAMLRRLGCQLPIELWYRGPAEMNAEMKQHMEEFNVTFVDAYEQSRKDPVRRLDSWELKAFAITYSSFEEVLYLDADNVPVRDPEPLFDLPQYLETGTLFWPDRYTGPGSDQEWLKRTAWVICRVPYRLEPEIEAGQLLINKRKCWLPLMLVLHMNEHSDFYYEHFYGDKDTFHLAWHRAEVPFALIPTKVQSLGKSDVIVQHDMDGQVLFQHRHGDKWSLFKEPMQIPGFLEEGACRELLADLRRRWRPPVRSLPEQFTSTERAAYDELCNQKVFEYALENSPARKLELLHDFSIGGDPTPMEAGWTIEADKEGEPVLSICNLAPSRTCFLRRSDDGTWRGRLRFFERQMIALRPVSVRD